MAHSNTQTLLDYWQARRLGGTAPARATIDPMDFHQLLPQVFILGRNQPGEYLFRLAGGFVIDLHARDLRGVDFSTLWAKNARMPIKTAMQFARRQSTPVHLTADVQAAGQTLPIEMLLLPLANPERVVDRFLGLYQPTAPVVRLRGLPADRLALTSVDGKHVDDVEHPIRLVAVGGQRVR